MSNDTAIDPGGITIIVKICGITNVGMAQAAKENGADFIGLVFAPSRRRVNVKTAQDIVRNVPGIGKVGVFVNAPLTEVREIAERCQLDYIQLHGGENKEYCRLVGYPVIKALKAETTIDTDYLAGFPAEWILLDTINQGHFGGTGECFDWYGLQKIRELITKPLLIAGGLNRENVITAIDILRPDGVDVSSGVETDGEKDAAKIYEFMQRVRQGRDYYS